MKVSGGISVSVAWLKNECTRVPCLRIQYLEDRKVDGLWFRYGENEAYKVVKNCDGEWDTLDKLWRFPSNEKAMLSIKEIRDHYPTWPVRSNLDNSPEFHFSLLENGRGKSALVLHFPLPELSSRDKIWHSLALVKLIKISSDGDDGVLAIGDTDRIALIVSLLECQGAEKVENGLGKNFGLSFSDKKIQVKTQGWAVEIICDLSNPLHYLLKPAQAHERKGHDPKTKVLIPWAGTVRITRKVWPSWEKRIKEAGIEWEGDDPSAEITSAILADFASVPGWNAPAKNGCRLHNYQKSGVEFCIKRGMRALIGDEMGVGKTAQAISAVEAIDARQILVVCSANARYVWEREITGWGRKGVIQHIASQLDALNIDARWRIATYDQLVARTETWRVIDAAELTLIREACPDICDEAVEKYPYKIKLKKHYLATPVFADPKKVDQWVKMMRRIKGELLERVLEARHDVVIVDEAHRVKNREAKRTKSLRLLTERIPFTLLLTGTPLRNNEHEAAVLLSHIDSQACAVLSKRRGYTVQDIKDNLQYFMIRRTKAEVLPELPEKTRQRIDLDKLDADKLDEYYSALEYAKQLYHEALSRGDSGSKARQCMLGALEMARSALGLAKVLGGDVAEFVREVVENKGCAVVFSAHHAVSDVLHAQLSKAGLKSAVVDGRTSQVKRAKFVEDFQEGRLDVFIGGIQSVGEAITLTRSDTVIFSELDWVPAALMQAEDRVHRIGQKRNCQIIHLIARLKGENLDEDMIDIIGSKLERIGNVLDEDTGNLVLGEGELKNTILDKLLGRSQTPIAKKVQKKGVSK
jgi:hypothetical protein